MADRIGQTGLLLRLPFVVLFIAAIFLSLPSSPAVSMQEESVDEQEEHLSEIDGDEDPLADELAEDEVETPVGVAGDGWEVLPFRAGSGFSGATSLAVDREGYLYVVDQGSAQVHKRSPSGELLAVFGRTEGGNHDLVHTPFAVAVDDAGTLYVTGGHRIQRYAATGEPLAPWGGSTRSQAPGQFNWLAGVAVDPHGNVYVADRGNHRVQKLSPTGEPLAQWGLPGGAVTVHEEAPSITIRECPSLSCECLDRSCRSRTSVAYTGGTAPGEFSSPTDVAVDAEGNVYVTDSYHVLGARPVRHGESVCTNDRIQKLSPTGQRLTQWGERGTHPACQTFGGLAVDRFGNIYVPLNNRIQKLSSTGQLLAVWGSRGTAAGQFIGPTDVAIDLDGNLYVLDGYNNNRVQRLSNADQR